MAGLASALCCCVHAYLAGGGHPALQRPQGHAHLGGDVSQVVALDPFQCCFHELRGVPGPFSVSLPYSSSLLGNVVQSTAPWPVPVACAIPLIVSGAVGVREQYQTRI